MLQDILKKLRRGMLHLTNPSANIAERARKERWPEIILELEAFYTLADGRLAGYSIIAGSPDHQRCEIGVTPSYERFKTRTSQGKLVVEDPQDLVTLTKLNSLYFLRDKMIPEAQKRFVRTKPNLQGIQLEIKRLEERLSRKYLANAS